MDRAGEVQSPVTDSSNTIPSADSLAVSTRSNPESESLEFTAVKSADPPLLHSSLHGCFSAGVIREHDKRMVDECLRRRVAVNVVRLSRGVLSDVRVHGYHAVAGLTGSSHKRPRSKHSPSASDHPVKKRRGRPPKSSTEKVANYKCSSSRKRAEIAKPSRSLMRSPVKVTNQVKVEVCKVSFTDLVPTLSDQNSLIEDIDTCLSYDDIDPLRDDFLDSSLCQSTEGEVVGDSSVIVGNESVSFDTSDFHSPALSNANETDSPLPATSRDPKSPPRAITDNRDPQFSESFDQSDDIAIDVAESSLFDAGNLTPSDFNAIVDDLLDSSENLVISSVYSLDESFSVGSKDTSQKRLNHDSPACPPEGPGVLVPGSKDASKNQLDHDSLASPSGGSGTSISGSKDTSKKQLGHDSTSFPSVGPGVSAPGKKDTSQEALDAHFSTCPSEGSGVSIPGNKDFPQTHLDHDSIACPSEGPSVSALGGKDTSQKHRDVDSPTFPSEGPCVSVPGSKDTSKEYLDHDSLACHSDGSGVSVPGSKNTSKKQLYHDSPPCLSEGPGTSIPDSEDTSKKQLGHDSTAFPSEGLGVSVPGNKHTLQKHLDVDSPTCPSEGPDVSVPGNKDTSTKHLDHDSTAFPSQGRVSVGVSVPTSKDTSKEHLDHDSMASPSESPGVLIPGSEHTSKKHLDHDSNAFPSESPLSVPGSKDTSKEHIDQDSPICPSEIPDVLAPGNEGISQKQLDPSSKSKSSEVVLGTKGVDPPEHVDPDSSGFHSEDLNIESAAKPNPDSRDSVITNEPNSKDSSKPLGDCDVAPSALNTSKIFDDGSTSEVSGGADSVKRDSSPTITPLPPSCSPISDPEPGCMTGCASVLGGDISDDDRDLICDVVSSEDESSEVSVRCSTPPDHISPEIRFGLRECRVLLHDVSHMECLRSIYDRARAILGAGNKADSTNTDQNRRVSSVSPQDQKSSGERKSNFLKNLLCTPSPHKVKKPDRGKGTERSECRGQRQLETPSPSVSQILPGSEVSKFSVSSFRIPKKNVDSSRGRRYRDSNYDQRPGNRWHPHGSIQDMPGGERWEDGSQDGRHDRLQERWSRHSPRVERCPRAGWERFGKSYRGAEWNRSRVETPRSANSWGRGKEISPVSRSSYLSCRGWVSGSERGRPLRSRQETYTEKSASDTCVGKSTNPGIVSTDKIKPHSKWTVRPLIEGRSKPSQEPVEVKEHPQSLGPNPVPIPAAADSPHPSEISPDTADFYGDDPTDTPVSEHHSPKHSSHEVAGSIVDHVSSESPAKFAEPALSAAPVTSRYVNSVSSSSPPAALAASNKPAEHSQVQVSPPIVTIRSLKMKALQHNPPTDSTIATALGLAARVKTYDSPSLSFRPHGDSSISDCFRLRLGDLSHQIAEPCTRQTDGHGSCGGGGAVTLKTLKMKAEMFSCGNPH